MDSVCTMTGNLTKDPEVRFSGGGRASLSFNLAVNHRYKQNDEWQEEAMFLPCVVFGSLAENIAGCCFKGTRLIVAGRMRQRDYTTDNGEERKVLELLVDEAAPSLRFASAVIEKNPRKEQN